MARDTFCSHCGARYTDASAYPRRCAACGALTWANPIPVAVALVPVIAGARTGLLVVRRAIPPVGRLALVGGFVEEHESWSECAARELREEAGVALDPARLEPFWYASSAPRPDRLLVFSLAPPIRAEELPPFAPNEEASQRGVVFGPGAPVEAPPAAGADAADAALAFPLHREAAARYFAAAAGEGAAAAPLDFREL